MLAMILSTAFVSGIVTSPDANYTHSTFNPRRGRPLSAEYLANQSAQYEARKSKLNEWRARSEANKSNLDARRANHEINEAKRIEAENRLLIQKERLENLIAKYESHKTGMKEARNEINEIIATVSTPQRETLASEPLTPAAVTSSESPTASLESAQIMPTSTAFDATRESLPLPTQEAHVSELSQEGSAPTPMVDNTPITPATEPTIEAPAVVETATTPTEMGSPAEAIPPVAPTSDLGITPTPAAVEPTTPKVSELPAIEKAAEPLTGPAPITAG